SKLLCVTVMFPMSICAANNRSLPASPALVVDRISCYSQMQRVKLKIQHFNNVELLWPQCQWAWANLASQMFNSRESFDGHLKYLTFVAVSLCLKTTLS